VLFLLVVLVGMLLIKSIIKEIKTREKIEKLATDLSKANTRLLELDKQKSEFVNAVTGIPCKISCILTL
jgi:hypothetical protein